MRRILPALHNGPSTLSESDVHRLFTLQVIHLLFFKLNINRPKVILKKTKKIQYNMCL